MVRPDVRLAVCEARDDLEGMLSIPLKTFFTSPARYGWAAPVTCPALLALLSKPL